MQVYNIKKSSINRKYILSIGCIIAAIVLAGCSMASRGKKVEANELSAEDRALLDVAVEAERENAPVYIFPEDPINIEVKTANGHYFIGFNNNFSEFSSDKACRTFAREAGETLKAMICEGELKELTPVSFTNSAGEELICQLDEWIVANGSNTKIYPPDNWDVIVAYCEELDAQAMEQ